MFHSGSHQGRRGGFPPRHRAVMGFPFSACLMFAVVTALFLSVADKSTAAEGDYVVNCGDSGEKFDTDRRTWTGDDSSDFSGARTPWLPFVRLHFYPTNYGNHTAGDSRFAVVVFPGNVTLLRNFSASQTAQALSVDYFFWEYSINVTTGGFLNLTFSPSPDVPNSYAFVNGIEILSTPDILGSESLLLVGKSTQYTVDPNPRPPPQDAQLFRTWETDENYIFGAKGGVEFPKSTNLTFSYAGVPNYMAPQLVYETARIMGGDAKLNLGYNLTWTFSVDPGFYYLVRLHFCEIDARITRQNERVFAIYLDKQTAARISIKPEGLLHLPRQPDGGGDFDVITRSGGIGSTVYQDFIVIIGHGTEQQDLWLELHPSTASKPEFYDAILNGLEIFKVSSFYGNLAGPKPNPPPRPSRVPVVAVAVPGGVVTVVLIFALALAVRRSGRKLRRCTPQSFQKFADAAEMKVPGDGVDSPVMNDARWRHDAGCAGDNEELPLVSASRASLA
ncbi:unnamed protein product [Spirodela intermedia]|uniref:Malectin-like domain-containing protein n=1 Tax=Spirodela intermedia TaxID=51605 RepID=A0A7I8IA39_SPIIN|nr:unnamed protein product [Spirodela intermedia]CAA6654586.1 unnamed protein product [Spirodela intermedia]